jgi:hypothetical protein
MVRAGGFECLLKVLVIRGMPMGLRPGGAVGCWHHLLPVALSVLVPLVMAMLGRCRVVTTVLTAEVGLDRLLTSGVLGGNI